MWISGGTNFWAEVRKTLVHLEFGGKANMRAIPRGNFRLRPMERAFWNGYGGFCGENYVMDLDRDQLPPAPWSNVLAGEGIGAVVTERGGDSCLRATAAWSASRLFGMIRWTTDGA